MKIDEFCEGIGLGADEAQLIYNNILPRDKFEGYDNIFKTDKEQFFCRLQAEENTEEIALIFYVMKSVELYSKFCESRISKEIYFDTFSDITIWSNRYKKNTGKLGLREIEWIALHLEMKLFRIGRLQFEMMVLEEEINQDKLFYQKGTKVLNVHIPEGEPLNEVACEEAFTKARNFFGSEYKIFLCKSWLLSPNLKKILSEESNIIKFQNYFYVYKTIYPFRQAEERIFGEVLRDKKQYAEDTTLQRKAKKFLLDHKDIGIGVGILK